jgi:hypothetical protein
MTPRTFKDASTFPWKFAREEISLVWYRAQILRWTAKPGIFSGK